LFLGFDFPMTRFPDFPISTGLSPAFSVFAFPMTRDFPISRSPLIPGFRFPDFPMTRFPDLKTDFPISARHTSPPQVMKGKKRTRLCSSWEKAA
jgi:hypothetical protein